MVLSLGGEGGGPEFTALKTLQGMLEGQPLGQNGNEENAPPAPETTPEANTTAEVHEESAEGAGEGGIGDAVGQKEKEEPTPQPSSPPKEAAEVPAQETIEAQRCANEIPPSLCVRHLFYYFMFGLNSICIFYHRMPTPPSTKRKTSVSKRASLPPVKVHATRGRRGTELYSPLDRLASKKQRADLSTHSGRRLFTQSLQEEQRARETARTSVIPQEEPPYAHTPPSGSHLFFFFLHQPNRERTVVALPELVRRASKPKGESCEALQAINAKQGRLRHEIDSIQVRSDARLTERKQRQRKRTASKNGNLPPLPSGTSVKLPKVTVQERGRGKLLYDICRNYGHAA